MSGVQLSGDWSKFKDKLNRMVGMNFTALHKQIGEYLVSSTKDRFEKGEGPDGQKWKKSVRAQQEGGQTLVDNNILQNSINARATASRVDVGTNVKYASVHQNGKVIKVKKAKYLKFRIGGKMVAKKSVKIPARPFIGINNDDTKEIRNIINDAIEERLR